MNKLMQEFTKSQLVTFSICLVIVITGLSYAYFSAVLNNKNVTNTVVVTGNMRVEYDEGQSLSFKGNMVPGDHFDKAFTVENTGDVDALYTIYLNDVINTFETKTDLVYELITEDGRSVAQTTCPSTNSEISSGIFLGAGQTHHYILRITFLETGKNQNDNRGKTFSATVGLEQKQIYAEVSGEVDTGAKVKIGGEEFYIINETNEELTLLAKYGLEVGKEADWAYDSTNDEWSLVGTPISNPSGKQSAEVELTDDNFYGVTNFASSAYWANDCDSDQGTCSLKGTYGANYPASVYNEYSNLKQYVDSYASYITSLGVSATGRLMTLSDFNTLGCDIINDTGCYNYPWLKSMNYAIDAANYGGLYIVGASGANPTNPTDEYFVVRPVIVITKEKVVENPKTGVFAYIYDEDYATSIAENDLYILYRENRERNLTQSDCNDYAQEKIDDGRCTNETCYCQYKSEAQSDLYSVSETYGTYDTLEDCNDDKWGSSTCVYSQSDSKYHIEYFSTEPADYQTCQSMISEAISNGYCENDSCTCKVSITSGTSLYDMVELEFSDGYFTSLSLCESSERYLQEENPVCKKVYSAGDRYVEIGDSNTYLRGGDVVEYGAIPLYGKTLVLRSTLNGDEEQCSGSGNDYTCSGTLLKDGRKLVKFYGDISDVDMCGSLSGTCTKNSLWIDYASNIRRIAVEERITPQNTANWFEYIELQYQLKLDSKFDTSNVTNMANMFYNYARLGNSIDLGPAFDTRNVKSMANMFSGALSDAYCASIKTTSQNNECVGLVLGPNFDTSNVVNMSGMFDGFAGRVDNYDGVVVELGQKFNTSKVKTMANMFSNYVSRGGTWGSGSRCYGDITINFPSNFDTSSVTNMANMFYRSLGCGVNVYIRFGNKFDVSKVKYMSAMFYETGEKASYLEIDFGSRFNPNNVRYSDGMFTGLALDGGYYNEDYKYSADELQIYVPAVAKDWIMARGNTSYGYDSIYFSDDTIIAKY